MKKILYLGNLYPLEASLAAELTNSPDWDIKFAIHRKQLVKTFGGTLTNLASMYNSVIFNEPQMGDAVKMISEYNPDYIFVRCWTKFAGFPIPNGIYYKPETDIVKGPGASIKFIPPHPGAKWIITESKEEVQLYRDKYKVPTTWLPYCVSKFWEKPAEKTRDIVTCGTLLHGPKMQSFNMLVKPLFENLPDGSVFMYVNAFSKAQPEKWMEGRFQQAYPVEKTAEIVGSAKIFVSPTTFRYALGAFSLKTIQGMGCGALTITQKYGNIEDYFGPDGENLLYANSSEECLNKVKFYLKHDSERKKIAERGYNFIHSEYNWTKHLTRALGDLGL